nr:SUMF1/EgtB/PvdO family nonheme iron enzyme [Lentimicrobium sp. S6]
MSGNLWEWVSDYYDKYTGDAQINPTGPAIGTDRVHRGGSWDNQVRVTYRHPHGELDAACDIGFRVVYSK